MTATAWDSLYSRWNGVRNRAKCLPDIVNQVILPEAVINFLALLGWNPGNDQEVMSMDEMIQLFDIHRCSKSGAKFDYKKGIWFNHQYIQLLNRMKRLPNCFCLC